MNSSDYQKEEMNAYCQLIDELLDSVGFEATNDVRLVFYLGDTLAGEGNWQSDDDLITEDLKTRSFSINQINKRTLHKFIRATDTHRLDSGEQFTRHWIRLSRVRFNKDFTRGFLRVGVWCGDLCSWTDSFGIQKKEGRWRVVGILKGPPA